jgi:DNA-binding CsgD family transcriptional regulator
MAPKVRKLLADMRSASVYPAFPKDFQPWMLSQREYQVLMHVIRGDDIETTARALGIQPLTVKSHRQRLYKKMGIKDHGVNTTWQVTRCALRSGLITVDDIL